MKELVRYQITEFSAEGRIWLKRHRLGRMAVVEGNQESGSSTQLRNLVHDVN
jgi:hypothetical protein